MRYFFIDLENVRNEGLEGVLTLNSDDMVYIFYSENAFSMAIPTLESITNSKCSSKFIKTNYIGKNAMDFQIVSLFGATIERCKEGSFYIISKDNGFRSAVSFCESYFGHYSIKCGVFPKIINAVSNELKGTKAQNSRKDKQKKQEETTPVENTAKPEENTPAKEQEAEQPARKSRTRSRRRGGSKAKGEGADAASSAQNVESALPVKEEENVQTEKTAETGSEKASGESTGTENKPGRLEYIYDILGEILSRKTIEIYAQTIDEGVAKSSKREELKAYFSEQLGDDEGDALFKVVQSDYELFKQKRPKKTSRSHRGGRSRNKTKQEKGVSL